MENCGLSEKPSSPSPASVRARSTNLDLAFAVIVVNITIYSTGCSFRKVPPRKVAPLVALGGTSVLGDFILLRGTSSILGTFLGGTFRKKHPAEGTLPCHEVSQKNIAKGTMDPRVEFNLPKSIV